MLAGGQQLALGPVRERVGADAREGLERGPQLPSCVEAATFAAQPLAVQKLGPGELDSKTCAREVLNRLAEEAVSVVALAQECAHARLDSARPRRRDDSGSLRKPLQRALEQRSVVGPGCRLDHLGREQRS